MLTLYDVKRSVVSPPFAVSFDTKSLNYKSRRRRSKVEKQRSSSEPIAYLIVEVEPAHVMQGLAMAARVADARLLRTHTHSRRSIENPAKGNPRNCGNKITPTSATLAARRPCCCNLPKKAPHVSVIGTLIGRVDQRDAKHVSSVSKIKDRSDVLRQVIQNHDIHNSKAFVAWWLVCVFVNCTLCTCNS
jgi:hypothetical protein